MKKIIKCFLLLFIIIPLFALTSCEEVGDLDRINYYEIKIDTREDGTLDMKYTITWTVLDDSSEGPLEWVQIGIPNVYVDEIKALTTNIEDIYYKSDGGSYIEIYFDKKYHKNEKLKFSFSFHQKRMYNLNKNDVTYNFKPGWFDEILVDKIVVLWNEDSVIKANTAHIENGYYKWYHNNLGYGETFDVNVKYNKDSFINLSKDLQYSDRYTTKTDVIVLIVIFSICFLIIIIASIVSIINHNSYMYHRGFIGKTRHSRRYYYHHYYYSCGIDRSGGIIVTPSSSHGGSGASGSFSCACACACAGGGRAGCSRKDFNHSSVNYDEIIKELNK